MIFQNFTFSLCADADCDICGTRFDIDDSEWHLVKASELTLELVDKFEEAATQQAEADGWKDNYCPECVENQAAEIRKRESLDDYGDYQRDEMMDRAMEETP